MSTFSRTALAATFILAAAPAFAETAVHAGAWTAQITKQEAQPVGSKDHVIVSQVAHGVNKSVGSSAIGDGAQVLLSETIDLTQGSGPQHGLYTLVDASGTKTSAYDGKITTTMVDGKPHTTGEGTFRHISGTGAYAALKNGGTYKFIMTSPTGISGEWKEDVSEAQR